MAENFYLKEIRNNLPRILALFDNDRTSYSYGMGDRYYWAWGLIDFGNGTFQGAAHGFAKLWVAKLWPFETSKEKFYARVNSIFEAANNLKRKDGSLEESFPNEGSYCVTALVAFDLLCALQILSKEISKDLNNRWTEIISPMIEYLIKNDETHAFISNHMATSVAALIRWNLLTGDKIAEHKAKEQLNKILKNQSLEGWFKEYEGADPGYQSLCTYYLADVHKNRPDLQLLEPLRKSIQFLWYFAHPDGSFGGIYGSRSTRFYYPAGIMILADEIPEAEVLSKSMLNSIYQQKVITLSSMDDSNLVPMFNNYVCAAVNTSQLQSLKKQNSSLLVLPCKDKKKLRVTFSEAGLLIDRGQFHYTIISTHKGGVTYHFAQDQRPFIDTGVVLKNSKKNFASTQSYNKKNIINQEYDKLEITSKITIMTKQIPSTFQFFILRLLSLTIFRSTKFREWFKKLLVNKLITRHKYLPAYNKRTIQLGEFLKVEDKTTEVSEYRVLKNTGIFVPIHMASKGYWQIQDEEKER